jgi:hypothetical protein
MRKESEIGLEMGGATSREESGKRSLTVIGQAKE